MRTLPVAGAGAIQTHRVIEGIGKLTMNSPSNRGGGRRPVSAREGGSTDSPLRVCKNKKRNKRNMARVTPRKSPNLGSSDHLALGEDEDMMGREGEVDDEELTETETDGNVEGEDPEKEMKNMEERLRFQDVVHDEQDEFPRSPPQPLPSRSPIQKLFLQEDTGDEMDEGFNSSSGNDLIRRSLKHNPQNSASQPVLPSLDSLHVPPPRAGSVEGFRSTSPNSSVPVSKARRHSKLAFVTEKRPEWPEKREGGEKRGSFNQHCSRRVKRKQSGGEEKKMSSSSSSSHSSNDLFRSGEGGAECFGSSPGFGPLSLTRSTSVSSGLFWEESGDEGSGSQSSDRGGIGRQLFNRSPSFSSHPVPVPESSNLSATPFSPVMSSSSDSPMCPLFGSSSQGSFESPFSQGSSEPPIRRKGSFTKKADGGIFREEECFSSEISRRGGPPVHVSRRKKKGGSGGLGFGGGGDSAPFPKRRESLSATDRHSSFEIRSTSSSSFGSLSTSPSFGSTAFSSTRPVNEHRRLSVSLSGEESQRSPANIPPIDLRKPYKSLNITEASISSLSPSQNAPKASRRAMIKKGVSHSILPISNSFLSMPYNDFPSPSIASRDLFSDEKKEKRKREEEGEFRPRTRGRASSVVAGTGMVGMSMSMQEMGGYFCRSCHNLELDQMSLNDSDDFVSPISGGLTASLPPAPPAERTLTHHVSSNLACSRCGKAAASQKQTQNDNPLRASHEPFLTGRQTRRATSMVGGPSFGLEKGEAPLLIGGTKLVGSGSMSTITGEMARGIFEGKYPKVTERNFLFVDCRFPYEYKHGHVKG